MMIDAYPVDDFAPPIFPSRMNRDWMDKTASRFAYRCLPMAIANSAGWEVRCPVSFTATWNGGTFKEDITLQTDDDPNILKKFCLSHFAHGVLTFHIGYLFRTPPDWGVLITGAPNWPKDKIQPLTGIVETDWLPFPSTMNWKFTSPGTVTFEKGEPFAFVMPMQYTTLQDVEPRLRSLDDNPELKAQYQDWSQNREDFNNGLSKSDPEALKRGWQRDYFLGQNEDGSTGNENHIHKLRMKPFKKSE